eukprot:6833600-Prymnesium_polylepis.1
MLTCHPELAELFCHEPATLVVGALVCVAHAIGCLAARVSPWWAAPPLAYTLGAFCKMGQFAMCHE